MQRLLQDYQSNESNFHHKYEEEVKKHDQTKKALNKAIKLANILLEEITNQSEGKQSELLAKVNSTGPHKTKFNEDQENTPTQNYAQSTLSPTPMGELHNLLRNSLDKTSESQNQGLRSRQPLQVLTTFTTEQSGRDHDTTLNLEGFPLNRKSPRQHATPNRELSELTSLIRSASRNNLIKNVKTSTFDSSRNTSSINYESRACDH